LIKTDGIWFKDEHGRTLLLRGVNLGGSSKIPKIPNGATYKRDRFYDHRTVSFVGRPFPLEEADEHYSRLKKWGFTFLRFLVTWEAIEHAGPGVYDEEYLDYLSRVVDKASKYGISMFIDPHQDVWSRFSGGDGAPGWTFDVIGMDITKFNQTGAAITHQETGDPFPRMIWPTNNTKFAAATMFTLFFGGNDFAPNTRVDGEPVQEYLQRHYINAMKQVAERLKGMPHVVGYDTLNEPHEGYIGWEDLTRSEVEIEMGAIPSPLQSMLLAAGIPQKIEIWDRKLIAPRLIERELVNPEGISLWKPGFEPIWRTNGVWDIVKGQGHILQPQHFIFVGGNKVDFGQDYLRPFINRYGREIRSVDPKALIFIESVPVSRPDHELPIWGSEDIPNIVSAPHWYDGVVLFMKKYYSYLGADARSRNPVIGKRKIRKSFANQLRIFKQQTMERLGAVPTFIGEIGIPYDLNNKKAYKTGDFRAQIEAFDRTMVALEDNLLSAALWNYTSDNTNARGDLWNDEDLSIFSRDQQDDPTDIHSGGRALESVVRPYPLRTAGKLLKYSFDYREKRFEFSFCHDTKIKEPSEIFVPDFQYPQGFRVEVSDGSYIFDSEEQLLIYFHTPELEQHTICILP
jgi:hypothetical protein